MLFSSKKYNNQYKTQSSHFRALKLYTDVSSIQQEVIKTSFFLGHYYLTFLVKIFYIVQNLYKFWAQNVSITLCRIVPTHTFTTSSKNWFHFFSSSDMQKIPPSFRMPHYWH